MQFQSILQDLVLNVDGAHGAIFLDSDGEAVDWYTRGDAELLRLRAAYIAVIVHTCRDVSSRLGLGPLEELVLEYEGNNCLIREVEHGYFFFLELDPFSNLAEAQRFVIPAIESLLAEIAA